MKFFSYILLFTFIFIFSFYNISAEINYSSTTKYYKTIGMPSNYKLNTNKSDNHIFTTEITKEEYEAFDENCIIKNGTIETTYKKLTSIIEKKDTGYRYKAILTWENMPKTRSYDIIGIYYNNDLSIKNDFVYFLQEYCNKNNVCSSNNNHYLKIFSNSCGASFKLPDSDLKSLKQTLYFDVIKNSSKVINSQKIISDYAHAIKNINMNNSKKYSINNNGLIIDDAISSYYDDINGAITILNKEW